jgi:hypothetical protein
MYDSQAEHSADCELYPFEAMPNWIFLDTSVVNLLVKYGASIFEGEPIPGDVPETRAQDIEALMHTMQVGQRANWIVTTSPRALREIELTPDASLRGDLLGYAKELLHTHNIGYAHSQDLGRRSADASFLSCLPDVADRELYGNAVGLGCDVFCTSDRKTIIRHRDRLPKTPTRIMTPIEWWRHFKPWGGLFV